MKKAYLMIAILFFIATSCGISDNDDTFRNITITEWNLINVTGGIAGVNHNFDIGDIVWFFNNTNLSLSVTNDNTDNGLEDAFDTGTYGIVYLSENEDIFLEVDGSEFGQIKFSGTNNEDMTIDQNNLTTGQGTDGFVYKFKRTTRVIEL